MQILLNELASHFQINPNEITLGKILHGNREKQNVCSLKIGSNRYLLKQHEITIPVTETGYTPFQIEKFTLSTLYKAGCLVPNVIWHSEKDHALLLEWCGEQTLDSVAQGNPASSLHVELNTIIRTLCKIEATFTQNHDLYKPYVFNFNAKETLHALLKQGRKTICYLQELCRTPLTSAQIASIDTAWISLSNRLLDAPLTLDSLDYQARNIVIEQELTYFIDYGSIGWDWQERRLVQYFNSIGAYQDGANFVSLLNRELVETYAKWVVQHREKCAIEDVAARIDAHHLLFYLSVTHRILEATAKPESKENQVLDQAWGDLRQRFHQALSLMENTDLSDNEEINRIRKMIRYFNSGN